MRQLLKDLILPPGVNLILGLAAFLLWRRYRPAAVCLSLVGFLSLYLLSLAPVAARLHHWLEPAPLHPHEISADAAQLIVVLGGGHYPDAPEYGDEYGGDAPSAATLQRLGYAAWLARRTGLSILASGGFAPGSNTSEQARPEAALMADMLAEILGDNLGEGGQAHPVIQERRSRNTAENAAFSAALIKAMEVDTVYLITHASHMPRAMLMFERQAIRAIPAPTVFYSRALARHGALRCFTPSMQALVASRMALHEYLGLLYYRLAY